VGSDFPENQLTKVKTNPPAPKKIAYGALALSVDRDIMFLAADDSLF